MITRQMTPFSINHFELSPLVYFIFAFLDLQNSVQNSLLCSSLSSTHLHAKDDTFKPVSIDILFYITYTFGT